MKRVKSLGELDSAILKLKQLGDCKLGKSISGLAQTPD